MIKKSFPMVWQQKNIRLLFITSAVFIVVLALFVRVYNLDLFPLNHDEAKWTLRSLEKFDRFIGFPVSCFKGYIQPFLSNLVFFSKKVFILPEHIVRVPAVIIGVATVILIFYLAGEMYNKKTGYISALLLCFLPWHVIQSRIGVSLILTPFFGCLIFFALVKSIRKQSNLWFLFSWLFLGIGSFYTYQASLIFIPIFLLTLICLKKNLLWLKPKVIFAGILIFLLTLYPIFHLCMVGKINISAVFYRQYHDSPFTGGVLTNLFGNFINNGRVAFESMFFTPKVRMLYGAALKFPLLINWITLFIILCSITVSLRQRKTADKILLIWLSLGCLGGLSGVSIFEPRYIIIILIPCLILAGRFIALIVDYGGKKEGAKRWAMFCVGILLCPGLIGLEIFQLGHYYKTAPFHLDECRRNSYGCQEAAQFLSKIPNIEKCIINTDFRMTVLTYLDFYLLNRRAETQKEDTYFVLWAPESHPRKYWRGSFRRRYNSFKKSYPDKSPVKTIYYPNGYAAINIFKVNKSKG